MNATRILRTMHADTKVRFKLILGEDNPAAAGEQWAALQPLLKLHEQIEDQFLYAPLAAEMPPGTRLGDWELQHQNDVNLVEQRIQLAAQLQPGTPEWQMCLASIMDALSKHVTAEEGQIFPRIEQLWGPARMDTAGQQMQKLLQGQTPGRHAPRRQRK